MHFRLREMPCPLYFKDLDAYSLISFLEQIIILHQYEQLSESYTLSIEIIIELY